MRNFSYFKFFSSAFTSAITLAVFKKISLVAFLTPFTATTFAAMPQDTLQKDSAAKQDDKSHQEHKPQDKKEATPIEGKDSHPSGEKPSLKEKVKETAIGAIETLEEVPTRLRKGIHAATEDLKKDGDSHKDDHKDAKDNKDGKDKTDDLKEKAKDTYESGKEKTKEGYEKAKDKAHDLGEKTKETAKEGKEKAETAAEDTKEKAKEGYEKAKEKAHDLKEDAKTRLDESKENKVS